MTFNYAVPKVTYFMNASKQNAFVNAEIYRIRLDEVFIPDVYDVSCVFWIIEEFCKLHRIIDELYVHYAFINP
ncbi:hypothetical protein A3464_18920 [Enterobacter genomosp. O]|nr:hypothetical protein A3464_18920 [Enterobacter genomosp. O]